MSRLKKQFRIDMKRCGTPLCAKQQEIKGVLNIVKTENPGLFIAASGETSTAAGQTRPAVAVKESIVAVAVKTESSMTEYTCVYVCMTMAINPQLRKTSAAGETIRQSLGRALATLNGNRQTNIFKKEVEAMQAALNDAVKATSS